MATIAPYVGSILWGDKIVQLAIRLAVVYIYCLSLILDSSMKKLAKLQVILINFFPVIK